MMRCWTITVKPISQYGDVMEYRYLVVTSLRDPRDVAIIARTAQPEEYWYDHLMANVEDMGEVRLISQEEEAQELEAEEVQDD